MLIQKNTVIYPTPTDELIEKEERCWRLSLPEDYKAFIKTNNGGIPIKRSFNCNRHDYFVIRFLCILEHIENHPYGYNDISVIETQIGTRLTANEDLIGVEVLPIAELFAGNYLCLDFREYKNIPSVCVWSHEESGDFEPVTYTVANSFSEFMQILES